MKAHAYEAGGKINLLLGGVSVKIPAGMDRRILADTIAEQVRQEVRAALARAGLDRAL